MNESNVTTTKKYNLPKGYSLIEVLLKTNEFLKNPINFVVQSMDKFGDNYFVSFPGGQKLMWTRDPQFIDHVLRVNQRNYTKSDMTIGRASEFFGKGLVFARDEYWRRQRRLIQPAFHRQKLMGLYGIMVKTIREVLEEIPTDKVIDIYPLMNRLSFKVLVNSLFDISLSETLLAELNQLFTEIQHFLLDDVNKPYLRLFYPINGAEKKHYTKAERMRTIMRDIIQERRQSKVMYTDILDMLINSTYEDTGERMNEDQIIDELLVLLFAGFETSSNSLSWLLYLLAKNPAVKEKLVVSLKGNDIYASAQNNYLKATINEGLRLYPPAWMTERIALKDDSFGEYSFPAGTHILSFFYGVHRNKKYWDNPGEFQPERFLDGEKIIKHKAFFPFGVGPRMCIGNHFALAEIGFLVHAFFEKFDVEVTEQISQMNPLLTLQPDKVMLKVILR